MRSALRFAASAEVVGSDFFLPLSGLRGELFPRLERSNWTA